MKRIDCDGIIFDMDGVLVSNSSYCQAIKETVKLFLFKKFGLKKNVNSEYIEAVKKIKGFNKRNYKHKDRKSKTRIWKFKNKGRYQF